MPINVGNTKIKFDEVTTETSSLKPLLEANLGEEDVRKLAYMIGKHKEVNPVINGMKEEFHLIVSETLVKDIIDGRYKNISDEFFRNEYGTILRVKNTYDQKKSAVVNFKKSEITEEHAKYYAELMFQGMRQIDISNAFIAKYGKALPKTITDSLTNGRLFSNVIKSHIDGLKNKKKETHCDTVVSGPLTPEEVKIYVDIRMNQPVRGVACELFRKTANRTLSAFTAFKIDKGLIYSDIIAQYKPEFLTMYKTFHMGSHGGGIDSKNFYQSEITEEIAEFYCEGRIQGHMQSEMSELVHENFGKYLSNQVMGKLDKGELFPELTEKYVDRINTVKTEINRKRANVMNNNNNNNNKIEDEEELINSIVNSVTDIDEFIQEVKTLVSEENSEKKTGEKETETTEETNDPVADDKSLMVAPSNEDAIKEKKYIETFSEPITVKEAVEILKNAINNNISSMPLGEIIKLPGIETAKLSDIPQWVSEKVDESFDQNEFIKIFIK